jgi:hypothetical protein
MERPGWFEGARSRAVTKGDQVFLRFPRIAPMIAPAPLSGIHRVPPALFAVASLVTGLTWLLSTGLMPFAIGEAATDLLGRIGIVEGVLFVALLAAVLLLYRYGRRRLSGAGPADSSTPGGLSSPAARRRGGARAPCGAEGQLDGLRERDRGRVDDQVMKRRPGGVDS